MRRWYNSKIYTLCNDMYCSLERSVKVWGFENGYANSLLTGDVKCHHMVSVHAHVRWSASTAVVDTKANIDLKCINKLSCVWLQTQAQDNDVGLPCTTKLTAIEIMAIEVPAMAHAVKPLFSKHKYSTKSPSYSRLCYITLYNQMMNIIGWRCIWILLICLVALNDWLSI